MADVPELMAWDEVLRLFKILGHDPSSQVAAALAKWERPATWEFLVMADLLDIQHRSKAKRKPKAYPRPWDKKPVVHGKGQSVSVEQWRAMRPKPN